MLSLALPVRDKPYFSPEFAILTPAWGCGVAGVDSIGEGRAEAEAACLEWCGACLGLEEIGARMWEIYMLTCFGALGKHCNFKYS